MLPRPLHPVIRQLIIDLDTTGLESSACDEHDHRQISSLHWRPDTQRQTVLRDGTTDDILGGDVVPYRRHFRYVLRTRRWVSRSIVDMTRVLLQFLRRHPSKLSRRWLRERDPLEHADLGCAPIDETSVDATVGFDDQVVGVRSLSGDMIFGNKQCSEQ